MEQSVPQVMSSFLSRSQESYQTRTDEQDAQAGNGEVVKEAKRKFKFSELSTETKYSMTMLVIAQVFSGSAYSLLAPFFPKEARRKGVSLTVISLVFSCFELVAFIVSPIIGTFISQLGVKLVYTSGVFVAGICAVLFGFLDRCPPGDVFIVLVFLIRILEAIGASSALCAAFSYSCSQFPEHASTIFAVLDACYTAGMMLGPLVGSLLYKAAGFGLPFWVMGSLMVASGLMLLCCFPQPQGALLQQQGSILTLLRSPLVLIGVLCLFVNLAGLNFFYPTLADHLDQYGINETKVGPFFIIITGIYTICSPFYGRLVDKKNMSVPIMIIGGFVAVIAFLLVGPSKLLPYLPRELWVVTLGIVLFGFSIGTWMVPVIKCLVTGATELGFDDSLNTFGLVSGLLTSAIHLGCATGSLTGGALTDHFGFDTTSTIFSAVFLLTTCVCIFFFTFRRCSRIRVDFHNADSDSAASRSAQRAESEIEGFALFCIENNV